MQLKFFSLRRGRLKFQYQVEFHRRNPLFVQPLIPRRSQVVYQHFPQLLRSRYHIKILKILYTKSNLNTHQLPPNVFTIVLNGNLIQYFFLIIICTSIVTIEYFGHFFIVCSLKFLFSRIIILRIRLQSLQHQSRHRVPHLIRPKTFQQAFTVTLSSSHCNSKVSTISSKKANLFDLN
jgi:hypothetical protein